MKNVPPAGFFSKPVAEQLELSSNGATGSEESCVAALLSDRKLTTTSATSFYFSKTVSATFFPTLEVRVLSTGGGWMQ